MPRIKKVTAKDPLKSLVEELSTAEGVVSDAIAEEVGAEKTKKPTSEDVERKRAKLLKLADSKEISKTPSAIAKASAKVIEKVYAEWETSRMERATHFSCDHLISKFSTALGGLDAIEKSEEMEKELKNDPLLREDVEKAVGMITPWIPFIGILSSGITVGNTSWITLGRRSQTVLQGVLLVESSHRMRGVRMRWRRGMTQ